MDGLGINSRHLLAPTVALRTLEKEEKEGTSHLTVEEIPESQKCHKETNSPFRIKFLGAKTPFPCVKKTDMMGNRLVMTEFENGNRLLPKIFLGRDSLLGKHIGYSDEDSFEGYGNSRVVLT
ncbi:hypothetical protein NC653_032197 [Populus alba x Populus x berolinensis]|uniref:Uncharacterized protein n=1 Tax=Populus alba x Populus x berolinensis TaxID=444605 RepID=A0AAD6PXW8_9ROSI|nr:hypothetical protein NC653_032197 [Populus alba x Populus x berolinensis]